MPVSIEIYRANIGRWHGRVKCVCTAGGKTNLELAELQATLMAAAVVAILLVIGGVEMNPGPVGTMSWEDMEKIREIVREACQAEQLRELIREQSNEMREIKECVKEELRIITERVVENSAEVELLKTKMKELEKELNHVKWQQKMSNEEGKKRLWQERALGHDV